MPNNTHDDAENQEEKTDGLPEIEPVSSDASEKSKSKKKATKKRTRKSSSTKKETAKKKKTTKKKATGARKKKETKKKDTKKESDAKAASKDASEAEVGTVVSLTELNDDDESSQETSESSMKQEENIAESGAKENEKVENDAEKETVSDEDGHIDMPDFDDEDDETLSPEESSEDIEEDSIKEDEEAEDVTKRFAKHDVEENDEGEESEQEDVLGELPEETEKPTKPAKKKASKEQSIDDRLTSIYENPDGSMPDMTKFQGKSKWRFFKAVATLALACALLAAVAWLGFFVLEPKGNFSEEDVILSVSGQEQVQVGETVRYRIRYRNAQKVTLKKVSLRVRYPDGFVYESSSLPPTGGSQDIWDLGELAGGESGYIDIDGRLFGSAEQEQSLRAFLSYEPDNFSSEFQKVDTAITRIDDVPIAMEISGNTDVLPGAETALTITFDPSAVQGLTQLAIRLVNPEQFVVRSSSALAHGSLPNTWDVSMVERDPNEQSLQFTGVFTASVEGEMSASAQFQIIGWVENQEDNKEYLLAESEHVVTLLSQEVLPTLVINGSTSDLTVQPGEILSVSAVLKNAGEKALENVQARLVFDTPSNAERKSLLRWADLNDPLDGRIVGEQLTDEKRRGSIAWTKAEVPAFASFETGSEQVIDLTIPVKTADDEDLTSFATMPITALFEVSYDGADGKEIISTVPITLTVNSDTSFSVRDDVEQNDQGKDVHTVTLLIQNTFHDLKDIHVETDLYGDITWQEDLLQVPAGEVTFDEKTKKLTWDVDVMPVSVDVLALQFGVVLNTNNPTQTNLSSKVNFKATDTTTEKPIVKIGDELLLNVEEISE